MSNFNQFFKSQGAQTMVERFFSNIDTYNPNADLTDLKWHIEQTPTNPASYYIENGLTATHKVILEYDINYDGVTRLSEFEVPREIDGAFIIEGSYRFPTNHLVNDYDCRINMSGTGRYYINFDYDRQYDITKRELVVRRTNPVLGLVEKSKTYPFDQIDKISGLEKEGLKLTDRQIEKLQIKLDLDYKPEYITQKLIEECIKFGDDRVRDLIIDKKIESVSRGFMEYIFNGSNKKNFWGTRRKIQNYWTKMGKLQDQIKVLTMMCLRYWKGSSDASKGGSDLQVSSGINAINMEAQTNKIQIPQSVAYNTSFSDLICVGATPINQNVGKQNALTVSAHVDGDAVTFDVMDLNFNKETIPYLDYLNSKVCASEYVDYDNNRMKPDANNQVQVKYRLRRKMVPVDEVELIDMHPDYRLSEEVRRIPFVNYTDSVRIHMGSSMLKQSIPLVNAERPLVDTGNNEELKDNTLNEKFMHDEGVVKEITPKEIIIELPDKTTESIRRRSAIKSVNDVDVFIEPKVKVGQKLKKGDILMGASNLTPDTFKAGLNALVLFSAAEGLVNEDAVVVSESFSKKMRNYSFIDLMYDVKNTEAIKWIAPIGTKVQSKNSVMTVYKAVKLDDINKAVQDKLGGIFGTDLSEYTIESNLTVPNNIDEAYVSDVLIQENKKPKMSRGMKAPDLTFSHTSQSVIDNYNFDRQVIKDRYPEYIASDTLDPISLKDKNYKVVYTVRVRLIKTQNLIVGSKITNRYGGKGVISKILPDNEMPIVVDGDKKRVVEVIMNPYSTINRKIPSVNMEYLLGNIIYKIHDKVDEMKDDPKQRDQILPFLEKYYPGRFKGMTTEEFIKKHETSKIEDLYYMNVGSYSKITPEQLEQWAHEVGASSQAKVLVPTNRIADLEELKSNLPEDEYNKVVSDMNGKYTEVEKPLSVGIVNMIELYHIPSYSNRVTSSMFGVDINEYKDSPISGKGRYRATGQKIGEMELVAYKARAANDFLKQARGNTEVEDNQMFLNNLLGIGLTVSSKEGYNQGGSSLRKRISDMKVKFRLKNSK